MHDGFELVKAVGPFAQDIQDQVDLAGRFKPHNKKAPTFKLAQS